MNARASQLKKAQGSGLAGNFLSETTRPEAGSGLAEPDEVMKGKRGKQKQEMSLDGWRGCFPQPWAARARLPPAETRAGTPEAKVVTPGSWAPKPWKRRVGVMGEIQPTALQALFAGNSKSGLEYSYALKSHTNNLTKHQTAGVSRSKTPQNETECASVARHATLHSRVRHL